MRHRIGMIEAQSVCDTAAAIVADEAKRRMPEIAHQLDHVTRHRTLRIGGVRVVGWRLARIAVAAKIGADDGVVLRERRRDAMPDHVRLRITVQEQYRRPVAPDDAMDLALRRANPVRREAREEIAHGSAGRR